MDPGTVHFITNPVRLEMLRGADRGLRETGISLLSWYQGQWIPAGSAPPTVDDPALYLFSEWTAKLTGFPIDRAIDAFFWAAILLAVGLGAWGFTRLFKTWPARLVGYAGCALMAREAYKIADVQCACVFPILALIPLLLSLPEWKERQGPRWLVGAVLVGLVCGYTNLTRMQAGTGVFLFAGTLLLFLKSMPIRWKALLGMALVLGMVLPTVHFRILEKKRDAFLVQNVPGYEVREVRHPVWHPMYIALGYIPNKYVAPYDDSTGFAAVKAVDPDAPLLSPRYEAVMKGLVLKMVTEHPGFALWQLWLKWWVIVGLVLRFGNIGLVLAFWVKPSWRLALPFLPAMALYAIPGLIVSPVRHYVLGVYLTAAVFGVWMTGLAIDRWRARPRLAEIIRP